MDKPSQVALPDYVVPPFEVYVNGVLQTESADYDVAGSTLFFRRTLANEGQLGFWRWLSMALAVAGTYRKHDEVSIVFRHGDRRMVANLTVQPPP